MGELCGPLHIFHLSRDHSSGWRCHSAGAGGARQYQDMKRVQGHSSQVNMELYCFSAFDKETSRISQHSTHGGKMGVCSGIPHNTCYVLCSYFFVDSPWSSLLCSLPLEY